MAEDDRLSKDTVEKLLDRLISPGELLKPEELQELGLPVDIVWRLTDIHETGPTKAVDPQTRRIIPSINRGVMGWDLLGFLAEHFKADLSGAPPLSDLIEGKTEILTECPDCPGSLLSEDPGLEVWIEAILKAVG